MPTESGKPFQSEIIRKIRANWQVFVNMGWKSPSSAANHYYTHPDEWAADQEAVYHAASSQPRRAMPDVHADARIKSAKAVVDSILNLNASGFSLDEIQETIGPSYVDGSPWAFASISHIIINHPNAPPEFTSWARPMTR